MFILQACQKMFILQGCATFKWHDIRNETRVFGLRV